MLLMPERNEIAAVRETASSRPRPAHEFPALVSAFRSRAAPILAGGGYRTLECRGCGPREDELAADVVIVGGGWVGAAAMAACRMGYSVLLTEPTDWIGGQLTAQAVPPDEHPWIESFGCTQSYRGFRDGVRQYYRDHFPSPPKPAGTRA